MSEEDRRGQLLYIIIIHVFWGNNIKSTPNMLCMHASFLTYLHDVQIDTLMGK